ncbi:MAG: thioredoxin family protein [Candidatus Micrarchaeota archaeon]|nr:thioredoxin family protein [Candidatus Micrarchaeota archaeon]
MKKEGFKEAPIDFLVSWCSFSLSRIILASSAAVIFSILAIFLLHPYLALALMLLLLSFLVKVSDKATSQYSKIAASTGAVVLFLLALSLPAGDIGYSKCPEREIAGSGSTVKYFHSPFCIYCVLNEGSIAEAQKKAGFTLQYYDIRYCKKEAEKFGFFATPCFAVVFENGSVFRTCGALSSEELAQIAGTT